MNKRIITVAITGSIHTPSMSEHLPITPEEIINETIKAHEAGAAIAHIHVRDPENGKPSADLNLYRQVAEEIKKHCNIVLCFTTGGGLGMTTEKRVVAIPELQPELASFNFGSFNFALFHALDSFKEFKYEWEREYLAMTEDFILPNTFKTMREFSKIFQKYEVQPELEIYDVGQLNNVAFMIEKGHLKRPIYLQFVMGILGGIQPDVENLVFMLNSAKKLIGDFNWSVCAAGRHQFNMCTLALLLEGNIRVGLEDNLYLEKGIKVKTNAEQVQKIVRIAKELGVQPATSDEARSILGLKGIDKVNF
jgi:uncharacterized protein (DUF849 family)